MKSLNTTLLGIGGFIAGTWTQIATLLDGDAMTNPDWSVVIYALLIALGFKVAADDKTSTEEVENK